MKNEYFLALKGVNREYQSIFANHPKLCRQYAVGKTMKFHPRFPAFLVDHYSCDDWELATGYDFEIQHLLLVKVNRKHLVFELPAETWVHIQYAHVRGLPCQGVKQTSLDKIHLNNTSLLPGIGTTKLTVLEEVKRDLFLTAIDAKSFYEEKFGLPFVSRALDFSTKTS